LYGRRIMLQSEVVPVEEKPPRIIWLLPGPEYPVEKNTGVPARVLPLSLLEPLLAGCLFLSLLVAGYFLLALFFPPQAGLSLTFKKELDYAVPVSPEALVEVAAPCALELPVPATGLVELPEGYATGRVRFISLDSAGVTFPGGTVVWQKSGVAYRLAGAVTVPGFGTAPGVAEGRVVADTAGPAGNAPGFGSFLLPPAIRVQSLSPLSGGTTRSVRVITASDLAVVKQALLEKLDRKSGEALDRVVPPGYRLLHRYSLTQPEYTLPAAGSEYSGRALLELPRKEFEGLNLGKGLALLRSAATPTPTLTRVPLATNQALYRLLPLEDREPGVGENGSEAGGAAPFNPVQAVVPEHPLVQSAAGPSGIEPNGAAGEPAVAVRGEVAFRASEREEPESSGYELVGLQPDIIRKLKERGLGKQAIIEALTPYTKGGSQGYKAASALYDSLAGPN
jgi:hypothetical protein